MDVPVPPDHPRCRAVRGQGTGRVRLGCAVPLDALPSTAALATYPWAPERDLLSTTLQVITETAAHAGHLDVARELVDGRQRLVLTEFRTPPPSH